METVAFYNFVALSLYRPVQKFKEIAVDSLGSCMDETILPQAMPQL